MPPGVFRAPGPGCAPARYRDRGGAAFTTPFTSFVGRHRSIDEVGGLLDRHRLVTLTGPGGVGKTRLAVETARRREAAFADGATFVDLAPIDTPTLVASAVAAAAGVPEAGGAPLEDVVANALAHRHLLMLLDNCERVLDACAELVYRLLVSCPRLVVLATSRSPLRVEGELTWSVPPLSVPPAGADDPVGAVLTSEAGQLLVERARLGRPDFELSPADAAPAATICRRLDGVPLAIELAAGRLRALGVAEVAAGLEHRFGLLSSGTRTRPARQQTLAASIAWSHDLLGDDERRLFRRLAAFAAGFTVDAAEAVCAGGELTAADVRALLAELVDHSLVMVEERPGGRRYRLLESVRAYAGLRLRESGEDTVVRGRHLDHLLALTGPLDLVIEGSELEAANRRIEALLDDVRAAIEWSMRVGRAADGLRLAAALRAFWIHANRIQEGQGWLRVLLEATDVEAAGADETPPAGGHRGDLAGRASALLAAAHLCLYASDPGGQARLADQALTLAGRLGDAPFTSRALLFSGWAKVFLDPPAARATFGAARQAAEENGDRRGVENASWGLGWTEATSGDLEAARAVLMNGIGIARARRSLGLRYGLTMLGYVDILQARLGAATAVLDEAAELFVGDGDRFNRDRANTWQALAAMHRGRYGDARRGFDEAVASASAVGNPAMFAPLHLALLERAIGDHEAAAVRGHEALPALHRLGVPAWFEVQALVCLGDAALAGGGAPEAAEGHWRDAAALAAASGNPLARTVAEMGRARGARAAGDNERARSHLDTALRCAAGAGYRIGAIDALEALAVLVAADDPKATLPAADDAPAAATFLAAVDAERARTGYVRFPVDIPAYRASRATLAEAAPPPLLSLDTAVALAVHGCRAEARPSRGWERLTAAERRVAELVGEGLTNPEIGARLFISRRTVQVHLSRVFAKMGVTRRTELAAAVHERRLVAR